MGGSDRLLQPGSEEWEDDVAYEFGELDLDGNHFISAAELGRTQAKADVMRLIWEADIDGDGHISYEEFVELSSQFER